MDPLTPQKRTIKAILLKILQEKQHFAEVPELEFSLLSSMVPFLTVIGACYEDSDTNKTSQDFAGPSNLGFAERPPGS